MKFLVLSTIPLLLTSNTPIAQATPQTGSDLTSLFAQVHSGAPLRAAVLGGSITQAGQGWVGRYLAEQFPHSITSLVNAGMSATGSELGLFRLERDVLAAQPNLVFLETSVNDEGLSDAEAIQNVESLVVRLKKQKPPPAIVILQSAHGSGLNKSRHRAVAQHYGLLEVDLDIALKAHLQRENLSWSELMSDKVHPNAAGHQFYA